MRFEDLPTNIPGYRVLDSWSDVLAAIDREQGTGKRLKVFLYPCAPLQSLTQTGTRLPGRDARELQPPVMTY